MNDLKKIVRDHAAMIRLSNIDQQFKNQERRFCLSYSVKLRVLIHAHLSRLSLNPQTLEKDRIGVIRKCRTLIQEMCVCFSQLMMLAHTGQISKIPYLFSLENTMKLCPMIVQALWDQKNPLLQLPHIDEDILKYVNSKYYIKTLEQCFRLNESDKRKCLRNLTKKQYCNVCKVLGNMPLVNTQINVEVNDAEETNGITVGSLVTASVFLSRKSFSSLMNVEGNSIITIVLLNEPKVMKEEVKEVKEGDKKKILYGSQKQLPVEHPSEENKEDKKESATPEIKVQARKQTKQNQTPFQVTNLVDKEKIMMVFTAPVTPGLNKFTLCVRSDSYLVLDQFKSFTLDVKRAPEQPKNHPQYDFSSDEEEKREAP
ncbi:hypothetical protein QYM36_013713 [Artemia franciscana]|uniref:SEC63 domain-containing protein n=1 Tax=Artemia franciscana TaxID=6661 RepID=A0AA88L1P5_ARTSF|nr:hypothetical protein QYM36_013713 [Artemia franciscana]